MRPRDCAGPGSVLHAGDHAEECAEVVVGGMEGRGPVSVLHAGDHAEECDGVVVGGMEGRGPGSVLHAGDHAGGRGMDGGERTGEAPGGGSMDLGSEGRKGCLRVKRGPPAGTA